MTPRSALALLVLLLVAVVLLLRLGSRGDGGRAVPGVEVARDEQASEANPEPLAAPEPDSESPARPERGSAESGTRTAATGAHADELAAGHWIAGRVRFPAGTPADEACFVVADGRSFEHGEEHRVRVAPDGRFRVAFSEKTKKGRLRIEARYVFLERPPRLDVRSAQEEILLEPVLGGRLLVHLVAPTGEPFPADLSGRLDVLPSTSSLGGVNVAPPRRARLGGVPTHAFDGMLAGYYHLRLEPEELRTVELDGVRVEPGETREVELDLARGLVLAGRARDERGSPLADVRVEAVTRLGRDGGYVSDDHAETDAEGRFRLSGLAPGFVTLTLTRTGYLSQYEEQAVLGASPEDRTYVLARGARIAGTVLWPDGSPAGGASVAYEVTENHGGSTTTRLHSVDTAADGAFVVSGLGDEPLRLDASASPESAGNRDERVELHGFAAEVEPGTTGLVIRLGEGTSLAGTARTLDGAPLDRFRVTVSRVSPGDRWPPTEVLFTRAFDSPDGAFELTAVPSGQLEFTLRVSGYADSEPVRRSLPDENAPLELTVAPESSLSGVVLSPDGVAVPHAQVSFQDDEDAWQGVGRRAGVDGRFTLEGVDPGAVRLWATADGFARSAPAVVELASGAKQTNVELQLRRGATLTGDVIGLGGEPNVGREVTLLLYGQFERVTARTDDAGRFRIDFLPPGRGRVQVAATSAEVLALGADPGDESAYEMLARSAEVVLVDGETTHVVVALAELEPVRVTGLVLAGGEPMPGATLNAWSRAGSVTATADETGAYAIMLPAPGSYAFAVNDPATSSSLRLEADVPAVEEHRLDLRFRVGSVEGTVRGEDGTPVAGVNVSARSVRIENDPGPSATAMTRTDADGRYRLAPLVVHTYEISVTERGQVWPSDLRAKPTHADAKTRDVAVGPGETVHGIDFDLAPGGGIDGVVLRDGAPVANASVYRHDPSDPWHQPVGTDALGRFRLIGFAEGEITVVAATQNESSPPATVTVRAGEIAEVELQLTPIGSLVIALVQADGKLAKGEVELLGAAIPGPWFLPDRTWSATRVPVGTYTLRAVVGGVERTREVEVVPTESGEPQRVELRFD